MLLLRHLTAFLLIVVFTGAYSQDNNEVQNQLKNQQNDNELNLADEFQGNKIELDLLALVTEENTTNDDDGTVVIEFLSPTMDAKYKRGRMIEIRWSGGNPEDEYSLDLYSGTHHYLQIGELKNSGVYPWIIPSNVEPGKEYKLKLTNTEDFGDFVFSKTFTIKRRTPVALWLVPAAAVVVGGVVFLILNKSEDPISDLPAPPEPQ